MENYIYTDLACERVKQSRFHDENSNNVQFSTNTINDITVRRMYVKNNASEKETGVKAGKYTTIYFDPITTISEKERSTLALVVAKEIADICSEYSFDILICGLGNINMTTDSIGPKVIQKLTVTRHVYDYDKKTFDLLKFKKTSSIAPGVLAQTGIESAVIIKGICEKITPDMLLTVDSICARATERLCTTIQITDTGVAPGSGVKNKRPKIDKELLSIPVISIGFPTVMNSATMIYDCLNKHNENTISKDLEKTLQNNVSYYVTINEIDEIINTVSDILAQSINIVTSLDSTYKFSYDK